MSQSRFNSLSREEKDIIYCSLVLRKNLLETGNCEYSLETARSANILVGTISEEKLRMIDWIKQLMSEVLS